MKGDELILFRREDFLRQIAFVSNEIFILKKDGTVTGCNDSTCERFHLSIPEVVGRNITDLVDINLEEIWVKDHNSELVAASNSDETKLDIDRVCRRSNGRDFVAKALVSPYKGKDEVEFMLMLKYQRETSASVLFGPLFEPVSLVKTVSLISKVAALKDSYVAVHSHNVGEIMKGVGSFVGLPPDDCEFLKLAGILHDIGKNSISSDTLNSPKKLTPEERCYIQTHATIGYNVLAEENFCPEICNVVRGHHEKYDGSGYPDGLHGNNISFASHIAIVADVFDAASAHRPYHPAAKEEDVVEIILKGSGVHYHPVVVDALLSFVGSRTYERRSVGFN